jgi:hypothetical protein
MGYSMRFTQRAGVAVAVAVAIVMVLASASYAATSGASEVLSSPFSPPPVSVGSLVAHEEAVLTKQGIAPARALQALELQGQVAEQHLPLRIETALGSAYAGVWFDNAAAKFDVGVTSNASRQAVKKAVARTGLAGEVVETPVRSTWGALMGVQEQLSISLPKLLTSGDFTTGIDVARNAVSVTLSSAVPASERAALEREASTKSVNVEVSAVSPAQLDSEPRAKKTCEAAFTASKAYCEEAITAGVGWSCSRKVGAACDGTEAEPVGVQCTAGPMLIEGNETYMLTAGHCFGAGSPAAGTAFAAPKVRSAFPNVAGLKEIGKEGRWFQNGERDVAEVKVNPAGSFVEAAPTPVPALMAEWVESPAKPHAVEGMVAPVAKQMVCHEGVTSGERCGEVKTLDVEGPGGTKHLVEVTACGSGGDSGGPYVFGTLAAKTPLRMMGTEVGGPPPECSEPEGAGYISKFEPLEDLATAPGKGTLAAFRNQRLLTKRNQKRQAAGTAKAKFNGLSTSKKVTIIGVGSELKTSSVKVVCSSSLGEGEAGTETVGKMSIVFNSCIGSKGTEECTVKSIGAKSEGEVVTKTLKGELGNVASAEAPSEVGLLVEAETAKKITELTAKCLGSPTALEGKLAGEVSPADALTSIVEVEFAGTSTKPAIKAITVKAGNVKPKLELGGQEALEQTYLEMEFAGEVEVV